MQYPIIDLITSAYINNGWTGLDISTGKNLLAYASDNTFHLVNEYFYPFTVDNNLISSVSLTAGTTYTLSYNAESTVEPFTISVGCGNNRYGTDILSKANNGNGLVFITFTPTETQLSNGNIFALRPVRYGTPTTTDFRITNVMLELGDHPTPYEPYDPNPSNDFPNRLKLPMIHYFPHPVIDSLKRASEGTMTNKDREILTQYLTPLGIGGI